MVSCGTTHAHKPPPTYADLEIGLHRVEAETYQVELRFSDPASEADVPPARGPAALDTAELLRWIPGCLTVA